ncbi:MAG: cell division protein ZapA [Chitinophagaceae bacterium]|nr:MAG: cell division protein ZapA [Chitinophagaceae bacterium]
MTEIEMIPTNIWIADRQYRIRIATEQESTVRQSLKIINDKIIEFKNNFPGKDMQDLISMVLIWFATENKQEVSVAAKDSLLKDLTLIEKNIDATLGK